MANEKQVGFFSRIRDRVVGQGSAQKRSTSSAKLSALLNFLRTNGSGQFTDGYTQNIAVFRCVNQIATTLAKVPLVLYRGEELVVSGPLCELLRRPNSLMGHTKFVHTIVAQELLHGASYVFLDDVDSRGIPRALLPLTPDQVRPVRPQGNLYDLKGWQIGTSGQKALVVKPERIGRFEYAVSETDPLMPVSPLEVANIAVRTDYLSSLWNKQTIENSGTPAGILKWQGEGRLDEKDAGLIRDQWMDSYGGATNADSIAVLGANFEFQQVGQGAKDLQYAEGRRWNLAEIARAFNVPTLYLNEYSATGLSDAGLKVQEKLFYHNTIQPIGAVIVDVLNRILIQPIDKSLRLAWEWSEVDALRDDYTEKLKHADQLWRLGYPINRINEKLNLGMPDVPWGDEAFVQAQMITADAALAQSELFGGEEGIDPIQPVEIEETTETEVVLSNAIPHRPRLEGRTINTPPSTHNVPKGYVVQSLILSKGRFSTKESAIAWIEDHSFVVRKVDETENSWRFRQEDPNDFEEGTLRTIEMGEGVKAVVGLWADPREVPLETVETDPKRELRRQWWERQAKEVMTLERKLIGKLRRELMAQRSNILGILDGEDQEQDQDEGEGIVLAEKVEAAATAFSNEGVIDAILPVIEEASQLSGSRVNVELEELGVDYSMVDIGGIAALYINARWGILNEVAQRMNDKVAGSVVQSYADTGSLVDVAASVRVAFNGVLSGGKAKTIARTEVNTAVNTVRFKGLDAAGINKHEWVSENDDAVRNPDNGSDYDHLIDGATVEMGQPFPTGSGSCTYPGDIAAPPGDTINCRCVTIPVVSGKSRMIDYPDLLGRDWKGKS